MTKKTRRKFTQLQQELRFFCSLPQGLIILNRAGLIILSHRYCSVIQQWLEVDKGLPDFTYGALHQNI